MFAPNSRCGSMCLLTGKTVTKSNRAGQPIDFISHCAAQTAAFSRHNQAPHSQTVVFERLINAACRSMVASFKILFQNCSEWKDVWQRDSDMPARIPMTAKQREALLAPPMTEEEVIAHHNLDENERAAIARLRSPA